MPFLRPFPQSGLQIAFLHQQRGVCVLFRFGENVRQSLGKVELVWSACPKTTGRHLQNVLYVLLQ